MNIIISNSGDKPIYEQITSQIKNAIISGELEAGAPLPSLRYLAKELRVSRFRSRYLQRESETKQDTSQ